MPKNRLQIIWQDLVSSFPYPVKTETIKNVKNLEAAKRLLAKRNKEKISFAKWNDEVIHSTKDVHIENLLAPPSLHIQGNNT